MKNIYLIAFVLLAKSLYAFGPDSTDVKQLRSGQLSSSEVKSSMQTVQIITAEQIQHLNAQNLNELLRYTINALPVYVGTDGYTLDYIGNGRKNVRILLDGLPVWQTSIDRIDLSRWPIYDLDRIEILHGTSTIFYGSNANMAVINMISKWRSNGPVNGSANLNFSGKNEYNGRFMSYLNRGRNRYALGAGRYFFNGFQGTDSGRVLQWKPTETYHIQGRYRYLLLHNLEAYVDVQMINTKTLDRNYPIPNSLRVYDNEQVTNHLVTHWGIKGQVSKYHTIDFSHSYTKFGLQNKKRIKILSDLKSIEDPQKLPFDELKYDEYFAQIKIAKNDSQRTMDYEGGMEFSHQRDLQNAVLEAVKTNITQIALLGNVTYKPNDEIWLKGGLRYTHSNKFSTPLLYDAQLKYKMSSQAFFRAQYSRGFRTPTFNELFYTYENPELNIKGNLKLQSETYEQFNTSLTIQSDELSVRTNLMWQNTHNGIQLLAVNPGEQIYQFVNTKSAKFVTQSISVQSRNKYLNTRFVFSNNGVNQFPEEIGSYYFFQELAGMAIFKIPKENISLMYAVKYNGPRSETRKNALGFLEDFNQTGFWMMDASLVANMLNNRIHLAFGAKNIRDIKNLAGKFLPFDRYSDDDINSKVPLSVDFGRRGWISLSATF